MDKDIPATGEAKPSGEPAPSNDGPKRKQTQNQQQRRRAFNKPTATMLHFEGKCEGLKGHTYDVSDPRQAADVHIKTTKKIVEYVGRTYKYGADMQTAIEGMTLPFEELTDPVAGATRTQVRIWEKQVDEFVKRQTHLDENQRTVFFVVWGQCTDAMRAKLESKANHVALVERSDGVELLKNIRFVMFNFQSQKYGPLTIHNAKRRFYTMSQDRHATCQAYLDRFNNCVEVIEHSGALIGIEPGLVDTTMATVSPPITRETATALEMAAAEA
jgi:hypothetical protein